MYKLDDNGAVSLKQTVNLGFFTQQKYLSKNKGKMKTPQTYKS